MKTRLLIFKMWWYGKLVDKFLFFNPEPDQLVFVHIEVLSVVIPDPDLLLSVESCTFKQGTLGDEDFVEKISAYCPMGQ